MNEILNIQIPNKIFGFETNLIRTLLVPMLLTAMFVGTGMAILIPKIGEIQNQVNNIENLKKERQSLIDKRKFLASLDVEQMKNNTELIGGSLMVENNAYLLVGVIKRVAEKYGFEVDSFDVSPGEAFDDNSALNKMGIVKLSAKVSLVGPKNEYVNLVKGIENSLPILEIFGFESRESESTVILDMGINSFYIGRKEKQMLGKLSIGELEMTKDEKAVLDKISGYSSIISQSQPTSEVAKKEFVKYIRDNPFSDSTVISIPTP